MGVGIGEGGEMMTIAGPCEVGGFETDHDLFKPISFENIHKI